MQAAPIPPNETERLEALDSYQLLDTGEAGAYEAFTKLAAQITGAPMAAISLVDEHRQWLKSRRGIDLRETPREVSFCSHVVASGEPLVVTDAAEDPRFRKNPLVTGEPHVRFYAGVPLTTPRGYTVGTLCVMDSAVRKITQTQLSTLRLLADALMNPLESRKRFLSLIDAARIDLFVVNAKSLTIFFASRGACERLGYSIGELVGMSIYDVIPNLTVAAVHDILSRGRKHEEIVREAEFVRRDGTSYPVELRVDVTSDSGQERIHALALDMTQRKAQASEIALLLGAMNVAGDVILVYTVAANGELQLSYANDAFAAQSGYAPEESLGRDLEYFRKGMPDDGGMHRVRQALENGTPAQAEIASYRKDGTTYWNQVSLHPMRDAGGAVTHWVSIERDITADVERTATLAEEHDRLLALTHAARRLFTTLDTTSIVSTVREVVVQLLATEARVLAVDDAGICVPVDELGSAIWAAEASIHWSSARLTNAFGSWTNPRRARSRTVGGSERRAMRSRYAPERGVCCATWISSSSI